MSIAIVWSSPNKNGLTASAKNQIKEGIEKTGTKVEEIHLNELKLEHCRACGNGWGVCKTKGECIIKDDFADTYKKLVDADGIVFVTAVYWHDLTEQMKAFLDRLRRCESGHNGYLADKKCFLTACAGGTGKGAIECLHNLVETLSHMNMTACDRIPVIRFNKEYTLPALKTAGGVFADAIKES